MTPPAKTDDSYTASNFEVLEGLEGVRRRPAMYIGSTDQRGLQHCLWEILDNSVDEALAGYCGRIEITLHADGSVEIHDDGRGIPVDIEPKTGLSGLRVVFERLHAGGKFGGGAYGVAGGLHGVGAAVVNALSNRLDVVSTRSGKRTGLSFRRGVAGVFDKDGKFKANNTLVDIGKAPKTEHGTRVRYWVDEDIFSATAEIDLEALFDRARQSVYLVNGLTISVTDDRGDDERVEIFSGEGGIASLVEDLAGDPPLIDPVSISGEGTFQEVVIGRGEERPHTVDRHVGVEIALRWGTGYTTTLRSFVNVVETKGGGTHVTGFERAMVKCFAEAISATRLLKVDESVAKEDVMEGLTAVVVVRLPEPQFEGQTKDALSTNEVQGIVSSAVSAAITSFLVDSKRKADARKAMEKISRATKARLAARMQRDVLRRKTALESSKLPSKLADCRSEDVTRNEILIVEGDSAMGTAKAARDSEFQALLPIRGKILNTWRASEKQMLENIECAAIISALGAGSGPSFTLDNMRYGRFVVLTDADVDGHHIRTLLLTLCWRYMRPLVEAGRAYASVPPLYRVTLSHSGEYLYTYSDEEQAALLARLASEGKKVRDDIQRYKGLGEMSAEQLAETTMYPGKRRLRRVTVADAKLASACFETLMGNDASERRRFIVDKGGIVDPAKLDI